jgi:imidazoleglycerol-phosphate dehydratase/histidinol-phosphatase
MKSKRVLFIDRDGTIIVEPPDTKQIDSLDRLQFIPGAISALASIAKNTDFELVMVTNQDGLGTGSFPEESFWPAHEMMLKVLKSEGVEFKAIHIDRSFPEQGLASRKPGTAMLTQYFGNEYDLASSFVIGDRETDVQLARNLGCKAIFLSGDTVPDAALNTQSWREVESFIYSQMRVGLYSRTTKETSIEVHVSLYGTGKIDVRTGLGFFDHMLHALGAHAGFDLRIQAEGDLHVDEHHLVEDVGIALGEAINRALNDRSAIERFGFVLPMDEALAQVAIDLAARFAFEWDASFTRERIGDVPTEMFKHFFKSLCEGLRCALHISVTGENEHHKAEAIFKGVGRALRGAVARDLRVKGIPSTKGVL